MGQSAGVVHKTEEETERCMMRSDRLWLWVAVIGGLIGGVLMRHQDHTVHYHYEDHVEITDGFYAGRSGTVSTCWADLFGYRSYSSGRSSHRVRRVSVCFRGFGRGLYVWRSGY